MTWVWGSCVEILDDLGLVHVDPVAQGNEAADTPSCSAAARSRKAAPTVPLWEAKAILPGVVISGQEAHMRCVGHVDALAVGPDDPEAGLPDHLGQFVLEALPVRPGLGKAAGDDDGALDPLVGALLQGRRRRAGPE